MNRQLKFRIWLSEHNQFIYPHICDFIRGGDNNVIGRLDPYFKYEKGLKFNALFVHSNFDKNQMGEVNDHVNDVEHVIQQFTGLKDKNGNDIYEGDVILNSVDHRTPTMCVVGWSVYDDIGFMLYYPFKEPMEPLKQNFNGIDLYEGLPMCYGRGYGYEVIGNIFENPELLEKLT